MPSPANSISVAAGGTTVTGTLTDFVGAEDDTFFVGGLSAPILSVDSTTSIRLKTPLSASAIIDALAWSITRTGPYWSSTVTVNARITDLIAKLDAGLPLGYDGAGPLAGRVNFDSQQAGFKYLQTDANPFVLFIKNTNTISDWSTGQTIQGPPGPISEFRVNPTTFEIESRVVDPPGLPWVPLPGGDLDTIIGTYRTDAAASAATAVSARDTTTTARDVTTGARDATLTARDLTLGYRDTANTAATNAQGSANAAATSAALLQSPDLGFFTDVAVDIRDLGNTW